MAYDLIGLRAEVRNRLDDESYDSGVLDQFINDTHRQVLNTYSFPFMEKEFSGTLLSGASTFQLPTDAQTVISFRLTAPDDAAGLLPYMAFRQFDETYPDPGSSNPGKPIVWTFINTDFKVHPKTDQVYELDLRYLKIPTTLTGDTDVPDVPEEFKEILVLGAHQRALERDDAYNEAQVVEQKWDLLVEDMVRRLVTRQIGSPNIMRTSSMNTGSSQYRSL